MNRTRIASSLVALGVLAGSAALLNPLPASAQINHTGTRLVLGVAGAQPNGEIYEASTSPDRHYLVFTSDASNLVAGDDNGVPDVFVKDLVAGTVSRVSTLPGGGESDSATYEPSISDNGRYVAFTSDSDLFDEDNDFNFEPDVYVVDRDLDNDGTFDEFEATGGVDVRRMSVGTGGIEADFGGRSGKISGNGAWVAFATDDSLDAADTNSSTDVYVRSTTTDNTQYVSKGTTAGGGGGDLPSINASGRYVTFATSATDLVTGQTKGGLILQDRDTDNDAILDEAGAVANEHLNKSTAGTVTSGSADTAARASISPDGSCVAFKFINGSGLTADAVPNAVYVRNRTAGTTVLASKTLGGLAASEVGNPAISPNCKYVGFDSSDSALAPFDASIARDVYVKNLQTGVLDRVSAKEAGIGGLSATGTSENAQVYDAGATLLVSSATKMSGADGGNGFRDPFLVTYTEVPTCTPGTPTVTAATRVSVTVTLAKCSVAAGAGTVPTGYQVTMYNRTSATPIATQNVAASATTVTFSSLTTGSLYRFKVAASAAGGVGPTSVYSGFSLPPFKTLNQFTTQQFTDMAGRAPTSTELTTWSTALTNGTQTAKSYAVAASNFANWAGNNAAFIRLYQVSYGTAPATAEFNTRTASLRTKTTTATKQTQLETISAAYAGTASWKARYPAADSNTTFVTKVFTNAGVAASASRTSAINSWASKLTAKTVTRAQVVARVTGYVTTNAGQPLVVPAQVGIVNTQDLFTGLLRRPATAAEVTTWKPQSTTATASQTLAQFLLSAASYDARIP